MLITTLWRAVVVSWLATLAAPALAQETLTDGFGAGISSGRWEVETVGTNVPWTVTAAGGHLSLSSP